jgi:hypothetical protein
MTAASSSTTAYCMKTLDSTRTPAKAAIIARTFLGTTAILSP